MTAAFTIVMATYNRPCTAIRAARSAIAQTFCDWTMLVIGDGCTDDTGERLAALGDPRIRFINLPERFGEQAGPNSIGMALAQTPFVAFLNHDDIWLDHHLAEAHARLSSGVELYWARAAFFTGRGPRDDAVLFCAASPEQRSLDEALDAPLHYAEPMSSWAATRDLLQRAGRMPLSGEGRIVPIEAYVRRLWALGPRFEAGRSLAVLKDRVQLPPPIYGHPGDYAEPLIEAIETGRSAGLLERIEDDLALASAIRMALPMEAHRPGGSASSAELRRGAGLELDRLQLAARGRPWTLTGDMAVRRTGRAVDIQPDFDAMLDIVTAGHV
jgi:hypothetical protein